LNSPEAFAIQFLDLLSVAYSITKNIYSDHPKHHKHLKVGKAHASGAAMVLLEKQWVNVQEKTFTKWSASAASYSSTTIQLIMTAPLQAQQQDSASQGGRQVSGHRSL
jgi:hypothetical protein